MRALELLQTGEGKGDSPRQNEVQTPAQTVDIRGRGGRAPAPQFRRQERRSAHGGAPHARRAAHVQRQTEVGQLDLPSMTEQQVLRLDVPVEDSELMRVGQARCGSGHQLDGAARRQRTRALNLSVQAASGDVLEDHEPGAFMALGMIHAHDVGVLQTRHQARFLDPVGGVGSGGTQRLQCYAAPEHDISRQKHVPFGAAPDALLDHVVADRLAYSDGHSLALSLGSSRHAHALGSGTGTGGSSGQQHASHQVTLRELARGRHELPLTFHARNLLRESGHEVPNCDRRSVYDVTPRALSCCFSISLAAGPRKLRYSSSSCRITRRSSASGGICCSGMSPL